LPLCADSKGFSLHAAVRCAADDRLALEQLCRFAKRCKPSPARGLTLPKTVQATRRPGRWSRLDPSVCRIDGIGLATRDEPQTVPEKTLSVALSTLNRTQPTSMTDLTRVGCPVRGAKGKAKGRLKTLSSICL
jgi:hypothetical protein